MNENKAARSNETDTKGHNPPASPGEFHGGHAPTMQVQEGHHRPAMSEPAGPPPAPIPGVGNIARPAASQPQQVTPPSSDED